MIINVIRETKRQHETMNENIKKRLRNLTDFLLLNVHALPSSGLMQGRAGIAVSLFESAVLLDDSYLENQAFELLKQSLLTHTQQIDMSSGLGGIGYALLYAINGNFLDANFEELYNNQCRLIEEQTKIKLNNKNYDGFELLDLSLFWHVQRYTIKTKMLRNQLLMAAENKLEEWFRELTNIHAHKSFVKATILSKWTHYLRIVATCQTYKPPIMLFKIYTDLYKKDYFKNEWEIGHWLNVLSKRITPLDLSEIANQNCNIGKWKGAQEEQLFSTHLHLLYLMLHNMKYRQAALDQIIKDYVDSSQEELETSLSKFDIFQPGKIGLHGIAYLLLLLCAVYQLKNQHVNNRIHFILGAL